MNRIYKSIWNEQTGTYVAVSENVKAKGKRSGASLLAGAVLAVAMGASAQAQTVTVGDDPAVGGNSIVFSSGTGAISGLGTFDITELSNSNRAVTAGQLNTVNEAVIENKNDIAALDTRVTTSEGKIGALETGLGTANTNISGLTTQVTTAEGKIGALETGLGTANTNISGLTTRVTTAEGKIGTLETGLGTTNTNISGLTTRVGETETDITTLKTTLSDLGVAETTPGIKYFRVNSDKDDASATGVDSVAIGPQAESSGLNSVALGFMTQAQAENAFAAGVGAVVTEEGESAIALGDGAIAGGAALGSGGIAAIAIGRDSKAGGSSSVALGDATVASASKTTALGADSTATAANAIAIGGGSANATGSFAAGSGAVVAAGSSNSIALGTGAGAGTNIGDADDRIDLIAIGTKAGQNVGGSQNIAIGAGSGSNVSGYFNVALGQNSGTGLGVGSDSVVSIGREANHEVGETLQHAVAIGSYTNAATNAVSIGHKSDALVGGIAIGYDADAAENAVALGTNANAVSGSVALGLNSAASALDWAGTSYLTNQATPGSVVSVGNRNEGGGDATLRRIVNVADGAATSDAATVGQLHKAQTEVASLIGGGVTVQGDGSFSDFTIKDKSGTEHTFSTVAAGFALLANGEINLLPSDAVTFVSDTDKRITGVVAGTDNSDVVNVGQLKQALTDNKVQYFHVNSSIGANQGNNGAAGTNAMAIGPDASAGGDSSIAFGHGVITSAAQSIAIGNDVDAIGLKSTVIGNSGTMAINEGGVAIGKNAHSYGENAIVIGTGARSHLADSDEPSHNTVVIGTSAEATADNGTAIGMDAVATDERAVALGTTAQARGEDSMAFGSNAIATGVSSQASGTNANASGLNAQASGTGASASGYNAVATGTRAVGYATDGIAMGTGAVSGFSDPFNTDAERNTAGIAIGNQSLADQEHALALGVEAEARAKSSAAIGDNAEATAAAENGFAAGTNALVSAQNATAVGANTDATGVNASAFGNGAQATAGSALALGDGAVAEGLNSTAMGTGANAQKADSMALGTNAIAYHEGSVALGSGSVTGTVNVTRTPDATVDGVKYDFAGAQTGVISTVSVGSVGNERTISNVAAGQLTETSTDAINGSQLHATNKAVTALGNDLDTFGGSVAGALGGTSKYDPETHTVTAGLSVNGNDYSNVNDALQYVGQGWDVSGSGADKVNIGPGGAVDFKGDNNISVAQTGEKDAGVIAINLAKNVDLGADGSLTTGNTKVNNTGVTVGSGGFAPTTTVEAGKIVVTSAGGTGNNKSIVLDTSPTKAEITGLTNTTWNPAGTYNAGRAATEEQLKMVSDVAQNANQGWNVTTNADDATSENVAPGATVDFDNTDGNIVIGQTGTKLTFDLADNLSVGGDGVDGKVGVKGADGKDGVSINPDAIVFHGIDGVDGKDGSLTMGKGEPGVDGVDGITRIQYTDPDGNDHEVATLDDGLKFAGDIGSISHKLNETVSLTGGVTDADKLSDDANIGVVAGATGGLLLQLAKDLTGLNSATFSDGTNTTVINGEGLTVTGGPSVTVDGIDGGNKQITGVASGLGGTKLVDATGATLTNAANIGDLQSAANNLKTAGLNFVGNTGGAIHKDLGDTLSIVGGLADGAASTGANLRVDSDGSKLNLVMARNLTDLESITINNGPVINAGGINMGGKKITNLAPGTDGTDAVNVNQLEDVKTIANKGWNVTTNADTKTSENVAPGATVDFDNTDGNIVIGQTGTNLTFDLADNLSVGGDGKDGSIGVKGADGKDGVSINPDAIVFHGIDGVDGKNGSITMTQGASGVDGKDGITRIQYTDPDGKDYEVATLDDGLNFVGDDGTVVSRKLNDTLGLTGGAAAADLAGKGNIGVVADGTGALSVQLAKDIDLTEDGSLTVGDTVVDTTGLAITGASANDPSTKVEAGRIELFANPLTGSANTIVIDAGKGTIEGLSNRNLEAADFATAGRAATEEQLKLMGSDLTKEGLNFAGNQGADIHKDLGDTLSIVGGLANDASASDANIRVDSEDGELRIKLATKLTDLEDIQVGKDGVDGVDGTIGVNGKNGSSVVLNGEDGSIGLTGPRGTDGSDGVSTNISVKDGAPGVNGLDGETTTRIVYTDEKGDPQEVANLNDGLKFVGDDGNTVTRKLNETLGLTGGADISNLSADNIGVVQKDDGSLSIQLAKDLLGLNSATFTDGTNTTVINSSGLTITDGPSVTVGGIDGGNKQVTGVASGLGGINLADATGDTLTNAANIGDLQTATNDLTAAGLNFAGNTGADIHKDLGETLNIVGGLDAAAGASDSNIRVDSESGDLRIKLATKLTDLEDIQVGKDGVDGVDGTIGVNGKNGSSVVLNGEDGSIGLTGPRGTDGSDGVSTNISVKDGAPGVNGLDGETTTRIVYTDEKGDPQEVANLNDGLKFVGDDGNTVTRKLNQTLGLTGGVTEPTDLTGEGNIGVVQKDDGALSIQLAKDIDLTEDGSLTVGDTTVNDKGLVVHDVTANPTATTTVEAGKIELFANPTGGPANTIAIDANTGTIAGLTNKTIDYPEFANGSGRAATEEQLSIVNETANKGWNVTTNEADVSENVAPGGSVDFDNTDDNIVIAQDKTNLTFDLAKNIKVDSVNAGGTFLNSNGLSFVDGSGAQLPNTVFIKPDGIDMGGNKITSLAKGEISATSTDAVNGSQLSFLADSVQNIFGGDVSFDFEKGTFTSPTYSINGKDYSTVQEAIDKLAEGWTVTVNDPGGSNPGTGTGTGGTPGTGTGGPADILPGDQLTLVAGDNIDIVQKPKEDGNVNIEISVDPNLVVDSVTAGQTVMDDSGVKVGDKVHLGDTGLTVKGGPTGDLAFTADKVDVGGNKITNVADGTIAAGSKDAVNGGQIKDISQSVADALGGGSTVKDDGTVSAPSYTVGNKDEVVNNVGDAIEVLNQGWTLNAGGNNSQVQAGDKVSLLNNDGNIVITQVVGSAEVNFALNDTITVTEVNATTVNATTVNASTFKAGNTIVNNNGLSFVNNEGDQVGPSVSVDGINAGSKTITNVAAGVNETDAVNVGQLQGAVTNINNQINSVRGDLRRVDRDARAGTASAAAMANLPQAYLPGKSMFAVSTAGHRGEQGFAAGLSTISDNGKWVLKGSVSGNSRGDTTYGAGVGYQW